jgi:hypothetical protein
MASLLSLNGFVLENQLIYMDFGKAMLLSNNGGGSIGLMPQEAVEKRAIY